MRKHRYLLPIPRGYCWQCPDRKWPRDNGGKIIVLSGAVLATNSTGETLHPGERAIVSTITRASHSDFGGYIVGSPLQGIVDTQLTIKVAPNDKFWLVPTDSLQ